MVSAEYTRRTKLKKSTFCYYNAFVFKYLVFRILSPKAMVFLKPVLQ